MAVLNTPGVEIRRTEIKTQGLKSDIIMGHWRNITLVVHIYLHPKLFGRGYRFSLNFRTIEVTTNKVQNNHWNGDLDSLGLGSWFWLSKKWDRAWDAVRGDDGMYIFRPYFVVDANKYSQSLYKPTGGSKFAVGEEHYFLIEASTV